MTVIVEYVGQGSVDKVEGMSSRARPFAEGVVL